MNGPFDSPLSGMMSLQGRARGVIECWQTNAVKLPENNNKKVIKLLKNLEFTIKK